MGRQYTPQEWLARFYNHLLMYTKEGEEAKKYLKERGINEKTIEKFKLGFSPKNEQITLDFLKLKGFNLEMLATEKILTRYQSGRKRGKIGDLFRGRITIPITDFKGDVVAFGGRSMKKDDKIKYINSPSSNQYVKGDNLFGFSYAEKYIRKSGFVILVEGYFDFLQVYQAGFKNVVAVLGVALTPNQALLLKDVTSNAVIVFDGDEAGKKASFKIAKMLKTVGVNVTIASTKNGDDPDDYIRQKGVDAFVRLLKESKPFVDAVIEYYFSIYNNLQTPLDKLMFVESVLEQVPENNVTERKEVLSKILAINGQAVKPLYDELVKRGL